MPCETWMMQGVLKTADAVGCPMVFFYPTHIWVFPKIGIPQNGWFIMENPIKMDDLGGKPTIFGNIHMSALDFQRCFQMENEVMTMPRPRS